MRSGFKAGYSSGKTTYHHARVYANAENNAREVSYITFKSEVKILNNVEELKAVELSKDEDESSED